MLSRNKMCGFKFENILFENIDIMEKFLNDFKLVYNDFIYVFDGKVLNIFNKNKQFKKM